jgi:hypothetical protein
MRLGTELTDERIASMTEAELQAWLDAEGIGAWEPNVGAAPEPPAVERFAVDVPEELAAELRAEAALRRQAPQRCLGDLLLLGLRHVQAHRRQVRG